jgi:type II secretion system protein G
MKKGFTLIELLIVVAIIAILAAIAVPNFLEAQTRSKVSRSKADLRSIATALEAYRVDTNKYVWPYIASSSAWRMNYLLTTPVAYMTSITKDAFGYTDINYSSYFTQSELWYATQDSYKFYNFPWQIGGTIANSKSMEWNLQSRGPDRDLYGPPLNNYEVDRALLHQYDPTNGTVSDGNVVRVGP